MLESDLEASHPILQLHKLQITVGVEMQQTDLMGQASCYRYKQCAR